MPSASFDYFKYYEFARTEHINKQFGVTSFARRWVIAGEYQVCYTMEWILREWEVVAKGPGRRYRRQMRRLASIEFQQWYARLRHLPVPLPDTDDSSQEYSDWE